MGTVKVLQWKCFILGADIEGNDIRYPGFNQLKFHTEITDSH